MPFIVSATGPEDLSQEEIDRRREDRLARKKAHMQCEACGSNKKKCKSVISTNLLCSPCIKHEAKAQKNFDSEEKLLFPTAEWLA